MTVAVEAPLKTKIQLLQSSIVDQGESLVTPSLELVTKNEVGQKFMQNITKHPGHKRYNLIHRY
jgi:hypothetical protein